VKALCCALEAAVLVEEAGVHREDALSDDVEAEVSGLDDAGVNWANCHLVHIVSAHGSHPLRRVVGVRCEGAHRRVAGKREAVEVMGLALIPACGLDEIDDALDRAGGRVAREDARPVA
jgi:hypothetical protein